MEQDQDKRRLLLAAAICLMVLMVWPVLFPRPKAPEKAKPTAADAGAVATATSSQPPPTVAATNGDHARTSTRTRAAQPTKKVEPKTFAYGGKVTYEETEVEYALELTNIGGGIQSFTLPTYKERNEDNEATDQPIKLANPTSTDLRDVKGAFKQMAGIGFLEGTTFEVPPRIPFEVVEQSKSSLHLRYRTPEGVVIEREYELRPESFEIEMAVTVRNESSQNQRHEMEIHSALEVTAAMTQGSGFLSSFVPPPDHLQGLCYADGEVEREHFQSLKSEAEDGEKVEFTEGVRWVAMDRQYFLAAIISRDRIDAKCRLSARGEVAQASLVMPEAQLKPGEEKRYKYTAYLGVKKQSVLTLVDANLEGAVDYKILGLNLAPLCTALLWVLGMFYGLTKSWGLSILGLTVLVKLILFPLNQRSGKSMRAMAALRPQMEAIKEKFPDDRQRQNEEVMKLYRDHNVSLGGGCLPILIQMPIWFALYRSLWVSVDLYQQGFLWIADLTTRDPYWILPVTLIIVMFLQQKMTPTTMDPVQQKMMQYTMPLMFGAMMSALPAGLCFYILVNTLLTIVQQHFINKSIGPMGGPTAAQEATT